MSRPPPPAMQIALSSSTPCGATNATSSVRMPFDAYRPNTPPSDTPFSSSSSSVPMPAVTPKANAANVTCTLFAMIRLAITGRRTCGIRDVARPRCARARRLLRRDRALRRDEDRRDAGSRTTAVYAIVAGPKRTRRRARSERTDRRTSVGTSIAMKRRISANAAAPVAIEEIVRAGDESSEVEQFVARFAARRRAQPRQIDGQRAVLGDEFADAGFAERARPRRCASASRAAKAIQRGELVVTIAYRSRLAPVAPRAAAPRSRARRSLVRVAASSALSLDLSSAGSASPRRVATCATSWRRRSGVE